MATSTIDKKPAFLKAFIACADLTRAAKACKLDRSCHYDWLRNDPEYVKAFSQARLEAAQTIEDSAAQWALEGVEEPIRYKGQFQFKEREVRVAVLPDGRRIKVKELPKDDAALAALGIQYYATVTERYGPPLTIRRRSQELHARLLKAWMPERYGDKVTQEISGKNGGPIALEDKRLAQLSDEELAALIAIACKLTGPAGDGGGTQTPPAE